MSLLSSHLDLFAVYSLLMSPLPVTFCGTLSWSRSYKSCAFLSFYISGSCAKKLSASASGRCDVCRPHIKPTAQTSAPRSPAHTDQRLTAEPSSLPKKPERQHWHYQCAEVLGRSKRRGVRVGWGGCPGKKGEKSNITRQRAPVWHSGFLEAPSPPRSVRGLAEDSPSVDPGLTFLTSWWFWWTPESRRSPLEIPPPPRCV